MQQRSDASLMAAVQQGDRVAFAALVERHKDGLVSYLHGLCGQRERAEDLAQESFLRLYHRADRYVEQGKLRAYLYRLAGNLARSELRRERRQQLRRWLLLDREPAEPVPTPQCLVLQGERRDQLRAALATLPWRWRMPLVLACVEGLPYAEIAATLGCAEGTVKSRVSRGRVQLRRQLERQLLEEGDAGLTARPAAE